MFMSRLVRFLVPAVAAAAVAVAGGASWWAVAVVAVIGVLSAWWPGAAPTPACAGSRTVDVSGVLGPVVAAAGQQDLGLMTHEIRAATEGQLVLLQAMTASISQLSLNALAVAGGAAESASIAAVTADRARRGGALVRQLVGDLGSAVSVAHSAVVAIEELSQRVAQVSKLADVVNQVASRTKMVALNATIEAARAGEHGIAFAVVAHEVQTLAEQAARAAGTISALAASAGATTTRSAESGQAMGAAQQEMREGLENARKAGAAFEDIVGDITVLTARIDESAWACTAQAASSQSAMADAVGVTAAARSTVASAEVLSATSRRLERALDSGAAAAVSVVGDGDVAAAHESIAYALRPLFDVPREHAGRYMAVVRACRATSGEVTAADLSALDSVMQSNLGRFPDARGATVTVTPGLLSDQLLYMRWWVSDRGRTSRLRVDLDPASPGFYDYRGADWYRTPLARAGTWLSDPYFDEGGAEADIVTISVPAADGGEVMGVATADIGLGQIDSLCRDAFTELGRPAALVSATGKVVAAYARPGVIAGQCLDATLCAWISGAPDGWSHHGPEGVVLSKLPTLDWALLVWPCPAR